MERTYGELFDFIDALGKKGKIKEADNLKRNIVKVLNDKTSSEESVDLKKIEDDVIDKNALKMIEKLENLSEKKTV